MVEAGSEGGERRGGSVDFKRLPVGAEQLGVGGVAPVGGGLLIGLPALAGDKSSVPGFV